jgi:hypothetical protein
MPNFLYILGAFGVEVWEFLRSFGTICGILVCFPPFWYVVQRKIWQPWLVQHDDYNADGRTELFDAEIAAYWQSQGRLKIQPCPRTDKARPKLGCWLYTLEGYLHRTLFSCCIVSHNSVRPN